MFNTFKGILEWLKYVKASGLGQGTQLRDYHSHPGEETPSSSDSRLQTHVRR